MDKLIEEAEKYLSECGLGNSRFTPRDKLIRALVDKLKAADNVIEKSKEFISCDISNWSKQDKAFDALNNALSKYKGE